MIPVQEWRRLQAAARPSLKALLLEDEARTEELVPVRGNVAELRALGVDVLNPFA